jgi:hypothetical protein
MLDKLAKLLHQNEGNIERARGAERVVHSNHRPWESLTEDEKAPYRAQAIEALGTPDNYRLPLDSATLERILLLAGTQRLTYTPPNACYWSLPVSVDSPNTIPCGYQLSEADRANKIRNCPKCDGDLVPKLRVPVYDNPKKAFLTYDIDRMPQHLMPVQSVLDLKALSEIVTTYLDGKQSLPPLEQRAVGQYKPKALRKKKRVN